MAGLLTFDVSEMMRISTLYKMIIGVVTELDGEAINCIVGVVYFKITHMLHDDLRSSNSLNYLSL